MKAIYITADQVLGGGLKAQLAQIAPDVDLEVHAHTADVQPHLASGTVNAVLTDTQLADEDAVPLLEDVRRHKLPLVVIVAPDQGVRRTSYGALQASADDYVWSYAAGTGNGVNHRFAQEVSTALHRAIDFCKQDHRPAAKPLRAAYVGHDEHIRTFLSQAADVELVGADSMDAEVAVIDESPYDAIRGVRALRETAPRLPVVLLSQTEIHDPEAVALMLGIDRVLVKAGEWRTEIVPALHAVARNGHSLSHAISDQPVGAFARVPSLEPAFDPAAEFSAVNVDDRIHQALESIMDNSTFLSGPGTLVQEPGDETYTGTNSEWSARLETVTGQPGQLSSEQQARHDDLMRQLDETRAREAHLLSTLETERAESAARLEAASMEHQTRLTAEQAQRAELARQLHEARGREATLHSTLESARADAGAQRLAVAAETSDRLAAEQAKRDELAQRLDETRARETALLATLETERGDSKAQLQAAVSQHERILASERAERQEIVGWLKHAQDELRRRPQLVDSAVVESRLARRKGRLADLAVGVVTELDSLIGEVATTATAAVETVQDSTTLGGQLERVRRTASRAQGIARHFLLFNQWQAQPAESTDLKTLVRDLEPALQRLVGSSNDLVVRIDPAVSSFALNQEQASRLLVSLAIFCRDALPIGGQIAIEVKQTEAVASWDPSLSGAEPLPFTLVAALASGHAPQAVAATPSFITFVQECDGHCEPIATDEPATGLGVYLPRGRTV